MNKRYYVSLIYLQLLLLAPIAAQNCAADYYKKALAEDSLGKLSNSLQYLNQAIVLDPGNAPAFSCRGMVNTKQGNYGDALTDFNKALSLNPTDADTYINRGLLKRRMKDYKGAIEDYNQALKFNPSALAYSNRGAARQSLGKLHRAIRDYNKALDLDPNYAPACFNRALAEKKLGKIQRALLDYDLAIMLVSKNTPTLSPGFSQTQDSLILSKETASSYGAPIDLNTNDAKLGLQRVLPGGFAELIGADAENTQAYFDRANARQKAGKLEEAISDYSRCIELNPKDANAYESRGLLLIQMNQTERGCLDLSKAGELGCTRAYNSIKKSCH
jgi:tetratricopeptide (TPR) repeat protein